jgi:hypothetical protein
MLRPAIILITLLLAVPAMSVELFRYRGAAKDGGKLEYVFDAGAQNSPNANNEREGRGDRRRLYDDLLSRTGRSTGDSRISDNADPFLAPLLFRHDQGADAPNVFRRPATGWDSCCAQSG